MFHLLRAVIRDQDGQVLHDAVHVLSDNISEHDLRSRIWNAAPEVKLELHRLPAAFADPLEANLAALGEAERTGCQCEFVELPQAEQNRHA
jgi:hypothetical protein